MKKKQSKKICETCDGTGHDKNSGPVVTRKLVQDKHGVQHNRHVTIKQGSGCLVCLGRGVIES